MLSNSSISASSFSAYPVLKRCSSPNATFRSTIQKAPDLGEQQRLKNVRSAFYGGSLLLLVLNIVYLVCNHVIAVETCMSRILNIVVCTILFFFAVVMEYLRNRLSKERNNSERVIIQFVLITAILAGSRTILPFEPSIDCRASLSINNVMY